MIPVTAFVAGAALGWAARWLWEWSRDRRTLWMLNRDLIAMEEAHIDHFNSEVFRLKPKDKP